MKKAFFECTYDLLRQSMCLPDGIKIESITHDPKGDCLVVVVSGDDLPDACIVREGRAVSKVWPWIKQKLVAEAWVPEFDRWGM